MQTNNLKYKYFDKYGLSITVNNEGDKVSSPVFHYINGMPEEGLFAVIIGHSPMEPRYFPKRFSFEEEILVVENLIKYGRKDDRYPLAAEAGQITIYKNTSYVYYFDGVINEFDIFDGSLDYNENEAEPIMVIPSKDVLGLLKDWCTWKSLPPASYGIAG